MSRTKGEQTVAGSGMRTTNRPPATRALHSAPAVVFVKKKGAGCLSHDYVHGKRRGQPYDPKDGEMEQGMGISEMIDELQLD